MADEIAKTPKEMQAQLKKNAFFVLEQLATGRTLVLLAQGRDNRAARRASR